MQTALRQSPGTHSGVLLLKVINPRHYTEVLHASASLLQHFEEKDRTPGNLHLAVGFGGSLLEYVVMDTGVAEIQTGWWPGATELQNSQSSRKALQVADFDLFIQISAYTQLDLTHALRAVTDLLSSLVTGTEIFGARLRSGEEPFGFRDGPEPEVYAQEKTFLDVTGPEGGSWVWVQLVRQDVFKFYEKLPSPAERAAVIGRSQALVRPKTVEKTVFTPKFRDDPSFDVLALRGQLDKAGSDSSNSHIRNMSTFRSQLIRRGFPCRVDRKEALTFIAAAKDPNSFELASEAFKRDPLVPYVEIDRDRSGLFFCPKDHGFVVNKPRWMPHGACLASQNPIELAAYELPTSEGAYLQEVRQELTRVMKGKLGEAKLSPVIDAVFGVVDAELGLEGHRIAHFKKLRGEVLRSANVINGLLSRYFTKG